MKTNKKRLYIILSSVILIAIAVVAILMFSNNNLSFGKNDGNEQANQTFYELIQEINALETEAEDLALIE
ncbi:MAG: hypothetical protein IKM24_10905, partial [Clostridia bacterium]|nr:hypothetical protein [Clostridia bacterium]